MRSTQEAHEAQKSPGEPAFRSSSAGEISNVRSDSNGPVKLDVGPFHHVSSDASMVHVFTEGQSGEPDEITLSFEAHDFSGQRILLRFDYAGGEQSFEFGGERGVFELATGTAALRASTGAIHVEVVDREHLRLRFEGVVLVPAYTDATEEMPMPDGRIEGHVRRVCLTQPMAVTAPAPDSGAWTVPDPVVDEAWQSTFCTKHADVAP